MPRRAGVRWRVEIIVPLHLLPTKKNRYPRPVCGAWSIRNKERGNETAKPHAHVYVRTHVQPHPILKQMQVECTHECGRVSSIEGSGEVRAELNEVRDLSATPTTDVYPTLHPVWSELLPLLTLMLTDSLDGCADSPILLHFQLLPFLVALNRKLIGIYLSCYVNRRSFASFLILFHDVVERLMDIN